MKKVLIVILTVLMLCSCTPKKQENPIEKEGADYINLIINYEVREKNLQNNTDNPEFDEFLEEVFLDSMNSDYLNLHFNVVDYKALNIEKPPVDLGIVEYAFDQENVDFFKQQLADLQAFDYDSLSYRQQYDYEALEYSLYETLADKYYYRYSFLLSAADCLPEDLISNFVDYTFYDVESIDDYITCLEDIDRFFDDILIYTEEQYKDGLPLLNSWIDYTVDACDSAANKKEDNEFIVSFDKKIDALDFIDDEQKKQYKEKNRQVVLDEVIPAFEKISKEVEKYRNKAKESERSLYKMNKDYAKLVYILRGSNNDEMEEVFQQLKDSLDYLEAEYVTAVRDPISLEILREGLDGKGSLSLVGKECLDFLKDNAYEYYPDLGEVDYSVEVLDPDTAPSSAIAYYWPSPIDDVNQNIIRTNPNNMEEGFETYSTLSHEGFPGHLYQHVFYHKTNPHHFRSTIGFMGYTEGWAVNAQFYAFQFSGLDDYYAASALFTEEAYYFLLYSIIDVGVNYFGWKEKDIIDYFEEESQLFSFDNNQAKELINVVLKYPGMYIPYGIGYSNFMALEKKAKDALGDKFDYVKYHEAVLKNGPLPFNILEGAVDEYIQASN